MKHFVLSLLIFSSSFSFAQYHNHKCVTDFILAEMKADKKAAKQLKISEQQIQEALNKPQRSQEEVYQIPVVIHVIHLGEAEGSGNNISTAQIMSGMTQLNNSFRNNNGLGIDTKIEFVLAKQDPNGNSTTGIVRVDASGIEDYATNGIALSSVGADEVTLKAASIWPSSSYYNIWIVSEIEGNDGNFGTQGYAYLPGASSSKDGTVILNSAWGDQGTVKNWNDLGVTITHELGHALGLYHTFYVQNAEDTTANGCPTNADCSLEGDLCCDTDPHKVSASFTCTTNDTNPCTGNPFGDVVQNYMDYSDQTCQVKFTADQTDRMRATIEGPRASLLISKGLKEPVAACTGVDQNPTCVPTTGSNGLSGYYAGIGEYTFNDGFNSSSFSNVDSGYVDETDNCAATTFVNPDSTYEMKIKTLGVNTNYVKGWIDYNNDGEFESSELVYNKTQVNDAEDSVNIVIPSSAVQNTFLRVRIMVDLQSAPTDACDDPNYGQAEDYALYIYPPSAVTSSNSISSEDFKIFPNPTNGILNVVSKIDMNNQLISVYNTQGQVVKTLQLNGGTNNIQQINLKDLQKGVYFIKVNEKPNFIGSPVVVK